MSPILQGGTRRSADVQRYLQEKQYYIQAPKWVYINAVAPLAQELPVPLLFPHWPRPGRSVDREVRRTGARVR